MDSDSIFSFGFNDARFSDRLLRIEITNGGEITSVDSVQDRKRRRLDAVGGGENEKEGMSLTTTNPPAPRVTELHISSLIFAAKSPFFYKLFTNGMIESQQKVVTLRIEASEEEAVMELMNFIYTNSLSSVTEVPALLRVLIAADKFDVVSCVKYCTRSLLNIPMTLPNALLILRLPWFLLISDHVKPLTDAARHYVIMYYKDITKFPVEELMALPLAGIMTLVMSNDLMIASEDIVYELALTWAQTNYPVLEERQEILRSLVRDIRFHYMTYPRLEKILTSDDFTPPVAYKLVNDARSFKAEPLLHRQCIVYLDLTRKECHALYPANQICSQKFHLGGQEFLLSASCNKYQQNGSHSFGLFLRKQEIGLVNLTVDYEFSARWKPTKEFVTRCKTKYKFTGVESIGFSDLFGTSWASFIGEDSPYFINDVLHLRAQLSICP